MSEDRMIEWRPTLDPGRRARVDAHRDRFAAPASVFRQIRKELGLSQVEAALRLGTTQANVSKIERRRSIDVEHVKRLIAGSGFDVKLVLHKDDRRIEFAA